MFTRNDSARRFVNGTLGVVVGFSDEDDGLPIVKTLSGRKVIPELGEWSIAEGGKIIAQIKQVPLRLAWAITIHKSQGMSLDSAFMDLSRTFEYGQGYVALSRVRTFSGLMLYGMNERALEVHPKVSEKDAEFRDLSLVEEEKIQNVLEEEQKKLEKEFISRCGGKIGGRKKSTEDDYVIVVDNFFEEDGELERDKKAYSVVDFRRKYPNAYKGWTAEEDRDLAERFTAGESIEELMETFGRQRGSIRARLLKLELGEE
jgi:hypothetical protein